VFLSSCAAFLVLFPDVRREHHQRQHRPEGQGRLPDIIIILEKYGAICQVNVKNRVIDARRFDGGNITGERDMDRTVLQTANAPAAIGAYSQAIRANGFIFLSGQLGLDPHSGALAGNSAAEQARQALNNISAILDAAGSGMDRVVKCTVLLDSIGDFAEVNAVYAGFFPKDPPARAAYAAGKLPLGALVEIEAIALA
jgi:2-iminobutanoate/2-iminopropanoate deaminase